MYPYNHGKTSLNADIFKLIIPEKYAFVETGTNTGHAVQLAIDNKFAEIYSIELEEKFYNLSKTRFAEDKNVYLYHTLSERVMPELCNTIHFPCFFWLDAHLFYDSPLLVELKSILSRDNPRDIIAIDDIRIINKKLDWGKTLHLIDITSLLTDYNIVYYDSINAKDDILVAYKNPIFT